MLFTTVASFVALLAADVVLGQTADNKCNSSPVFVRWPTLSGPLPYPHINARYKSPPEGFIYGTWHYTHTSQPTTTFAYNFQIFYAPILPTSANDTAVRTDLGSYTSPGSSDVTTLYSVDVKLSGYGEDVYSTTVSIYNQVVLRSPYEYLAWGYDTEGDPYLMLYVALSVGIRPVPPAILILSRVVEGPTAETVKELLSGVEALGSANLTAIVPNVIPSPTNNLRKPGTPMCDQSCLDNVDLIPLTKTARRLLRRIW